MSARAEFTLLLAGWLLIFGSAQELFFVSSLRDREVDHVRAAYHSIAGACR